nr:hypothetical protein [Chlorogloeopsis fritschii]
MTQREGTIQPNCIADDFCGKVLISDLHSATTLTAFSVTEISICTSLSINTREFQFQMYGIFGFVESDTGALVKVGAWKSSRAPSI